MSDMADNGRITFTVKELLAKVDQKLDLIVGQLDSKAESHDVERLEVRVEVLEKSAATESQLSAYRAEQSRERKRDRRWTVTFAASTLLGVLALGANVILNAFH